MDLEPRGKEIMADYAHVDIVAVWYKSYNFAFKENPGAVAG